MLGCCVMCEKDQLKIDMEPKKLLIISEPYVKFTARGYQAVIDVLDKKKKKEYFIYITARSIATPLEQLRLENNGKATGVEFWIHKKSSERKSPYVLSE